MTVLYALLVLLAAVLVTTITSLYDLTIKLFNFILYYFMSSIPTIICGLLMFVHISCIL